MKLTDTLVAEHRSFLVVFEEIENRWHEIESVKEARLLAGLVEGLLRRHAAKEEELLFAAYDHVLADRGALEHMSQDHDEIDERLALIGMCNGPVEARRLLVEVVARARRHFLFEETVVFPAVEQILGEPFLQELGAAGCSRFQS